MKDYISPTISVIELCDGTPLLAGSEVGYRGSYGDGSDIMLGSRLFDDAIYDNDGN